MSWSRYIFIHHRLSCRIELVVNPCSSSNEGSNSRDSSPHFKNGKLRMRISTLDGMFFLCVRNPRWRLINRNTINQFGFTLGWIGCSNYGPEHTIPCEIVASIFEDTWNRFLLFTTIKCVHSVLSVIYSVHSSVRSYFSCSSNSHFIIYPFTPTSLCPSAWKYALNGASSEEHLLVIKSVLAMYFVL